MLSTISYPHDKARGAALHFSSREFGPIPTITNNRGAMMQNKFGIQILELLEDGEPLDRDIILCAINDARLDLTLEKLLTLDLVLRDPQRNLYWITNAGVDELDITGKKEKE